MLSDATASFLWNLFCFGLGNGDSKKAIEWVATMYDRALEFPEKVEQLLTSYWEYGDQAHLDSLAITVLENFLFDSDQRTRLAARLLKDGKIDVNQAYAFLGFDEKSVNQLPPSIQRVADVYWLLRQDLDENIMKPSQDGLLAEALRDVAMDGLHAIDELPQ